TSHMPRAMWSGAISFGLVNIPIKLFTAVSRKNVSFNQIDTRTGSRIQYRKVSAATGDEVPNEAIAKGYQLGSGEYVLVGDDELAALDPEATRTIDIEQFVDLEEIDPLYYDAAYYVAPDKGASKPYALLTRAMEEQGKVAIARLVMRTKQYLAALRPKDGMLVMSTMVYADEVNDPAQLDGADDIGDVDVSERELRMAEQLVESLTEPFEPERYEDTHRNQVLELIDRKAAGEEEVVAPPTPAAEEKVVDLMAALEASVKDAKEARRRHPTAKAGAGGAAGDGDGAKPAAGGRAKSTKSTKSSRASKASKSTKAAPRRKSA
ncbi:MAG TPA: Ku protein, partial [Acidimicrobiales bacterium]|nr:Ku protein [Acidimicrobiales bacterium]